MRQVLLALLLASFSILQAQQFGTPYEKMNGNQTPDYFTVVQWWQQLDQRSGKVKMMTMGPSDAGYPLHLVLVSSNGNQDLAAARRANKRIILINNGIHPGEPDGIDASMLLARDIVEGRYQLPQNIVLAFIPLYNIGGALNRSKDFRVDQDGPEEFGSRGNSQNLDLNRDFIKCDSREARSFTSIFHLLDPDVFVDNHVSNGADYQHVMTLLTTQHSKLGGAMGDYLNKTFEPGIYARMKTKGYDLIPYVNYFSDKPENGWTEFWDNARYGSGYGALWNTFSFVPETHMLKPYPSRVKATYALMQSFIEFTSANSDMIRDLRAKDRRTIMEYAALGVNWAADKSKTRSVLFKGYEAGRKASEVSGLPRLFYDRSRPFEKMIPIADQYLPGKIIIKPTAYILPQGWWKVQELLALNKVNMRRLSRDTIIEVEVYRIEDYKSGARQYEMHHLNTDIRVSSSMQKINFRKGDWYIPMNQVANRFIMTVLEPESEDSYFAWNFFDAILGQKEGYSAYAFEDIAADYLKTQPGLQKQLEEKRRADSSFAKSAGAQLNYVFQQSPWYEPAHMRYPVFRLLK